MLGSTCVTVRTFSTMKQVNSKNRNRQTDETLDDSLRLAITNTVIDKGKMMSETPRPQASH